jgi:hypothetical protein
MSAVLRCAAGSVGDRHKMQDSKTQRDTTSKIRKRRQYPNASYRSSTHIIEHQIPLHRSASLSAVVLVSGTKPPHLSMPDVTMLISSRRTWGTAHTRCLFQISRPWLIGYLLFSAEFPGTSDKREAKKLRGAGFVPSLVLEETREWRWRRAAERLVCCVCLRKLAEDWLAQEARLFVPRHEMHRDLTGAACLSFIDVRPLRHFWLRFTDFVTPYHN